MKDGGKTVKNTNWKIGFSYWFVHFTVEVMCFYTVYRLFNGGDLWWIVALLFDILAFAPQAIIGDFCERHPRVRPARIGYLLMIGGAAVMLLTSIVCAGGTVGPVYIIFEMAGLIGLTIGNGFIHIAGALVTLRASKGRLAESAIFVGGGSFGVITGRLLSTVSGVVWLPFVLAALGLTVAELAENSVRRQFMAENGAKAGEVEAYDFQTTPCCHNIAAKRPIELIVTVLSLVVIARAYIGYGLPTAWNQTGIQNFFLFVFMGTGKMLGGILADRLGARNVGVASCLLAIPLLLVSNNIMWLSLIAVVLFSMTMAITLGGLVSILPTNPGVSFGITTLGLLIGTVPPFFWGIPKQSVCNILITVISILAAAGLWYCLAPLKAGEVTGTDDEPGQN